MGESVPFRDPFRRKKCELDLPSVRRSRDQFYHMMISRDHLRIIYFLGLKRLEHLNYGTFGCLTEI